MEYWDKQGFGVDKAEQYVMHIDHKPDTEALELAKELDYVAIDVGDYRPHYEQIKKAATKLRVMAQGPFLGRGGHSVDLFGFVDVVAYSDTRTIAVQATSRAKITKHLRDYRDDPEVRAAILKWIALPGREFVIFGWGRQEIPNARGSGTHVRWHVEQRWVTAEDMKEKPF